MIIYENHPLRRPRPLSDQYFTLGNEQAPSASPWRDAFAANKQRCATPGAQNCDAAVLKILEYLAQDTSPCFYDHAKGENLESPPSPECRKQWEALTCLATTPAAQKYLKEEEGFLLPDFKCSTVVVSQTPPPTAQATDMKPWLLIGGSLLAIGWILSRPIVEHERKVRRSIRAR